MKKQPLTERFQQLAGIKPLYELDEDYKPSHRAYDVIDAKGNVVYSGLSRDEAIEKANEKEEYKFTATDTLSEFDRDTPPEGPPELDRTRPESTPFEFLGEVGEEFYFARDGKHFVFISHDVEQGHTDFSYSRDDGDGYEDDGVYYDDVLSYNGEPYDNVVDIVNTEWGGENYMQGVASVDDGNTDLALITQNDTRSEYWDDLTNLSQKF